MLSGLSPPLPPGMPHNTYSQKLHHCSHQTWQGALMVETNPSDFQLHTKQLMMVCVTFCAPHHSHFQTLSMFLLPHNDKVNARPHLRLCVLPTLFVNTLFLKPCVAHCSTIKRLRAPALHHYTHHTHVDRELCCHRVHPLSP